MNILNIKEKIIKIKEQSITSLNNLMEDLISNMKIEIDATKLMIVDMPEDLGGFMKKNITDIESVVINQEKIKYFQEIMKNIKND
jgi:hypothetical protein